MDKIVYLLITNPGGIDGRDPTDRGGTLRAASFNKAELQGHSGKPWCEIKAEVVDVEAARRYALAKLSPLDKLILEIK